MDLYLRLALRFLLAHPGLHVRYVPAITFCRDVTSRLHSAPFPQPWSGTAAALRLTPLGTYQQVTDV